MATIRKSSQQINSLQSDLSHLDRAMGLSESVSSTESAQPLAEPVFSIRAVIRRRILAGEYQPGDIAAFRAAFHGVSQRIFAEALGISIDTLQNWEQGRRQPDGPAKALLRLLARHPRLLAQDLPPSRVAG